MKSLLFLLTFIAGSAPLAASHKVYLVHGYGGSGLEFFKIKKAIKKHGFVYENFAYKSLSVDVDSVAKALYQKIRKDRYDSISFVTHSMGALVVRSLFNHVGHDAHFPVVHRIVMMGPPNNGTPVADYFNKYTWAKDIAGPNLINLTTDSLTGARKYPMPSGEVGIIVGTATKKRWFIAPLKGENDGLVLVKGTTMSIEKAVYYVKKSHFGMLFDNRVRDNVIRFLKSGTFEEQTERNQNGQ